MIENMRIIAPYQPDEQDDEEPQAGWWFSQGFGVRQASKVTEQRAYWIETWSYRGSGRQDSKERWVELHKLKAWASTEDECKRRARVRNDLDAERRNAQRNAEAFVASKLKEICTELWEQAEAEYGTKLDRYSLEVMQETGYSDWFVARSIRPRGITVEPKYRWED